MTPRLRLASVAALGVLGALASAPGAAQELARRVQFARGESSAILEGSVVRGERDHFAVHARAEQRMQLRIVSREDNAVFSVLQPGRKQWLAGASETDDTKQWSGTLPLGGDYLIMVAGTRGNASYRLAVSLQ